MFFAKVVFDEKESRLCSETVLFFGMIVFSSFEKRMTLPGHVSFYVVEDGSYLFIFLQRFRTC